MKYVTNILKSCQVVAKKTNIIFKNIFARKMLRAGMIGPYFEFRYGNGVDNKKGFKRV